MTVTTAHTGHSSISRNLRNRHSLTRVVELLGMGKFQYKILIAAGLCFAADAMEVLLLSFLAVAVQNEWELNDAQAATITSVVFAGALLGTLTLGRLGDSIGRRPVVIMTAVLITAFGVGTAFTTSYQMLLLTRFMVGFGVGGLTVPFDILAEFLPTTHRGKNLLAIEYFWTAGTLLVPTLAYFTIGNTPASSNWRLFCILCAVPCLISTLLAICWVPESPRWLCTVGRQDQAMDILRKAAKVNGQEWIYPMQLKEETAEETGNLCSKKYRCLTCQLWMVWCGYAIMYYGTIMTVTLIFQNVQKDGNEFSFDYGAIFASCSAEFFGTTLVILTIDLIGRIPSQVTTFLLGGISVCFLCFAQSFDMPRIVLIAFAFLARLFIMAASCTTWVSTAEILPTDIRTTGHSAANAAARLGGFFAPYLVSSGNSQHTIGIVMLVISILISIIVSKLPETRGMTMGAASKPQRDIEIPKSAIHPMKDVM